MSIEMGTLLSLLMELDQSKNVCTFALLEKLQKETKKNNINPKYRNTISNIINQLLLLVFQYDFSSIGNFLRERRIVKSLNCDYAVLLACLNHYESDKEIRDALMDLKHFW